MGDVDSGVVPHLDPWDLRPELTCNVGVSISEYMFTIPLSKGILDTMNDPLTSKIDLASSFNASHDIEWASASTPLGEQEISKLIFHILNAATPVRAADKDLQPISRCLVDLNCFDICRTRRWVQSLMPLYLLFSNVAIQSAYLYLVRPIYVIKRAVPLTSLTMIPPRS